MNIIRRPFIQCFSEFSDRHSEVIIVSTFSRYAGDNEQRTVAGNCAKSDANKDDTTSLTPNTRNKLWLSY